MNHIISSFVDFKITILQNELRLNYSAMMRILMFLQNKDVPRTSLTKVTYCSVWLESKLKIFDGFWSVYGVPVSSTIAGVNQR